jgi:hypothetical protein
MKGHHDGSCDWTIQSMKNIIIFIQTGSFKISRHKNVKSRNLNEKKVDDINELIDKKELENGYNNNINNNSNNTRNRTSTLTSPGLSGGYNFDLESGSHL